MRPRLETPVKGTGDVIVKIQVPELLWRLSETYASLLSGSTPKFRAFEMILQELACWLNEATEDPIFLSRVAAKALRKVIGAIELDTLNRPDEIDDSTLHMSSKSKSGFEGVYTNGKGFKAMAYVNGQLKNIGTYQTAREAAWRRRNYYLVNKMPYGELEVAMKDQLNFNKQAYGAMPIAQLKHETIYIRKDKGLPIDGLTKEERRLEGIDPIYGGVDYKDDGSFVIHPGAEGNKMRIMMQRQEENAKRGMRFSNGSSAQPTVADPAKPRRVAPPIAQKKVAPIEPIEPIEPAMPGPSDFKALSEVIQEGADRFDSKPVYRASIAACQELESKGSISTNIIPFSPNERSTSKPSRTDMPTELIGNPFMLDSILDMPVEEE